jgi:hypothetical protein
MKALGPGHGCAQLKVDQKNPSDPVHMPKEY